MDIRKAYANIFSFLFIENKAAIYLSLGMLLFSFIVGLLLPQWVGLMEPILPQIDSVGNPDFIEVFQIITWNNIKASFLGLFLGIFILPTIFLSLLNGYIFGAVTSKAYLSYGFRQVLLRVLPHGLMEVPVIILSYAYGLIIGMSMLKKISGQNINILELYRKGIQIFIILLLPLIIFAAFIETLLIYFMDSLLSYNLDLVFFSLIILYLFYITARLFREYLSGHNPKLIIVLAVIFIGTIWLWMQAYGLRVMELFEQSLILKFSIVIIPLAIFFLYLYLENLRFKEEKERKKVQGAFQQYVNPDLIKEIMKNPEKLKLGGEKKYLTIFFSDIRGFTSISEKLTPHQLVSLMNEYLSSMSDIILENKGVIDKYIGDAIMAFWNAPLDVDNHELLACRSALTMNQLLPRILGRWKKKGINKISIGIGMHTGEVVVGNMGSSKRFDYTIMGDAVNLASRLEGLNKVYGTAIIISQSTYEKVNNEFACHKLDFVKVKGKKEPIMIYHLVGYLDGLSDGNRRLIHAYEEALSLYHKGLWDDAIKSFRKCQKSWPELKAIETMLERCREFRQTPPKDWDGAYQMTTK